MQRTNTSRAAKETHYAEAPLLNPQQLAVSFVRKISGNSRWDREDVEVPVQERGVYLVEAVRKDLRAYTVLMVSDLVMLTKRGNGRTINLVMDRGTGQPVLRRYCHGAHQGRRKGARADGRGWRCGN